MSNDTKQLEGLLEYLDQWQGALARVEAVLNAKPPQAQEKRAAFEEQFKTSPEAALKNALDSLAHEVLTVKAAREPEEVEVITAILDQSG